MAIQKNAGGGGLGNAIREPGEYRVKILECITGLSKSQKPMLTVTFQNQDEKKIRGYFVKNLDFHMKALEKLKIACGMKVTESAENLVGKECGILVEPQEPDENGRVFMQIVGYGAASEVTGDFAQPAPTDDIPF